MTINNENFNTKNETNRRTGKHTPPAPDFPAPFVSIGTAFFGSNLSEKDYEIRIRNEKRTMTENYVMCIIPIKKNKKTHTAGSGFSRACCLDRNGLFGSNLSQKDQEIRIRNENRTMTEN